MANNGVDGVRAAVDELSANLQQYMANQETVLAELTRTIRELNVSIGANRKVNHGWARDGVVPPIQPAMSGNPLTLHGFRAHARATFHEDKKFKELIHKPPHTNFRCGEYKEEIPPILKVVKKTFGKIGGSEIIEDPKKILENMGSTHVEEATDNSDTIQILPSNVHAVTGSSDEKEVLENIETFQISSSEFRKEPQEEISNHKIHRRIDLVPSKISPNFPQFNGSLDKSDIWPGKIVESLCDEEDEKIYDNLGCMGSTKFTLFIHAKYDPYDVEREIKGGAYIAVLLGEKEVSRIVNDFDLFQYYFLDDALNSKMNSRTSFFSAGEFDVGQEAYIFREFSRCRKVTTFDPGGVMRSFTYARETFSRFLACSTT